MYSLQRLGRKDDFLKELVTSCLSLWVAQACCLFSHSQILDLYYISASIIVTIAIEIADIVISDIIPNLRRNRCKSTPLSCNASIAETFVKQLLVSGSILTCQIFWAKEGFQSVIGAINLIGNLPPSLGKSWF